MLHKQHVAGAMLFCLSVLLVHTPSARAQEAVPGEYIVVLRKNAVNIAGISAMAADQQKATLSNLAQELMPGRGAEIMAMLPLVNAIGIKVPVADVEAADQPKAELLATLNDNVELVEPNYVYYQNDVPSDPLIDEMWFLDKIQAKQAWNIRKESPSIIVAVIDTGVFMGHEDLRGNIWVNQSEKNGKPDQDDDNNGFVDDVHGFDFFNDDPGPSADFVTRPNGTKEFEAHGTHVSGTIGALGDNGKGIVGITRRVRIMPLKFLGGPNGSGSTIDAISAIDYAVRNGAHIINASWGGGGKSIALERAIERANSAGVLFVAAAGNTAQDNDAVPHYPASYASDNIIAIAATEQNDQLTSFSCFGLISVDLGAPGRMIVSTIPSGMNPQTPTSSYAAFSGTSMATPIVSGSVALLMAEFPQLNHLEIRRLLLNTVDPVSPLSGKVATGGRLNLLRALRPGGPGPAGAVAVAKPQATTDEALQNAKALFRPTFRAETSKD